MGLAAPMVIRFQDLLRHRVIQLNEAFNNAMKEEGYAYAVIGWVASEDFYAHAVGATVIPDSEPGIFRGKLIT